MSARPRPLSFLPALLFFALMVWPLGYLAQPVQASAAPPILLVVNSAAPNPFGAYLGEILRAEGVVSFATVELAALDSATLGAAPLAILAETPLTAAQASMFTGYVGAGGRLIAMRPDPQLDTVLGVSRAGSSTTQGYIAINTAGSTGAGLSGVTLPFFGTSSHLTPTGGASAVAQLYSGRTTSTSYAAVVRSGGTATWAFDLARSVAYARQGNPANAGVDRDGLAPIRTTDIFYNAIDLERVGLPHADIQMRLFSRVIGDLLADSTPLPRLWYFPQAKRTLLVLTADDHGQSRATFDSLRSNVESRGGRITFYAPRYAPNPTAADTSTWRAAGHEVGLHPYAYGDGVSFDQAFTTNINWFTSQGRGAPSRTTRMHQIEWQGWADAASLMAGRGIGMDLSFYTWGPSITRPDNSQVQGYITGSGLPMRFVNESGALIPVYQQATMLIDEALIGVVSPYAASLTTAQALAVSQGLIDQSQAGNYSALATQFHLDYYPFGEVQPWVHGTMDYAAAQGIPMWTAERWLAFAEARTATTLGDLSWDAVSGAASFQVVVPAGADAQSLMLPADFAGKSLVSVSVNGASAPLTTQPISGRAMAFISLSAGSHSVTASYGQGPAATSTATATAGPGATATATATANATATTTPTSGAVATPTATSLPGGANQTWARQAGTCDPALQGAVLGIAGSGCGGAGTSFDGAETYDPSIIVDVASNEAPCPGIANGAVCYRMWYTGEGSDGTYRIGYAVSPDGRSWSRVPGAGVGGSVLDKGAAGGFDGVGVGYPHVIKDGATFKLWYVGYDTNYIGGIGYATSSDGLTWSRGASPVMAPSGVSGSFDRDGPNTPFVIKDTASPQAPCPGIANGSTCYRMWYEGVSNEGAYIFRIGYATSPDGIAWTRVPGGTPSGAVLDRSGSGFEAASVGVPVVIKEGSLYRMWYEGKSYAGEFAIAYASSGDGLSWARSSPSVPVWSGADDPATFTPDNVWGHEVVLDGATYRMWYSLSTQPDSKRIALTESALGSPLSGVALGVDGTGYALSFTMGSGAPAGGSILIALPPSIDIAEVTPGTLSGFDASATLSAEPTALTDAASGKVARGALVIRLSSAEAAGPKTVRFSLASTPAAGGQIQVRTFNGHDSLEYGAVTLAGGAGAPTATPSSTPAGPTSTSTPAPPTATSTPVPPTLTPTLTAGDLLHTTAADFSAPCVVSSDTWAGTSGDGAVGLRGAFSDDFAGPALASQWVPGTWSGGSYSPTFSAGVLQVAGPSGASIRSQGTYTARAIEGIASFGAGPWQHIGFGSLDFADDRYLLLSTFNSSTNLFARTSSGAGERRTDLGPVPAGLHAYRIEWVALGAGQDEVRYYIDGTLRATHQTPSTGNLYIYASHNSGSGYPALALDALHAYAPYVASGTLSSCALDAGAGATWGALSWQATIPAGTGLTVEVRTSPDGVTWGGWQAPISGATLAEPYRFAQYRLSLTTTDTAVSALVESVSLARGAAAPPPAATATSTPAPPTSTATATATSTPVPPTSTATATSTPVPPTATATATATSTPVPPTSTATATATSTPVPPTSTATATATATSTPVPPTATATSIPTPTPVALLNGGFEADIDANQWPDSWTGDTRFTRDTSASAARSGAAAGRHSANNNSSYAIDQRAGTGNIVPGAGYQLAGYVRIPTTADAFTFRPQVRWLNSAGTLLSTTTLATYSGSTAGWVAFPATVLRAPAGAVTAEVRMAVSSLNTTIYVDDLSFTQANLLANPGFENDTNSDLRPDSWTSTSRFVIATSPVRSGTRAGRLTDTANPTFSVNSSTVTGLIAGSSHAVSGWVNIPTRNDNFTVSVQVQWRNSFNLPVGSTIVVASHAAVTAGWAGFRQTLAVPAGADRAVLSIAVTSLNGSIYVDDFAFE